MSRVDGLEYEWDQQNLDHIAKHQITQITQIEAEQVVANRPIDLKAELRNGEERIAQVGETDSNRILVAVTTTRPDGKIRVVTAWPAKERLRRYFTSHKEAGNAGKIEEQDVRKRS